MDEVIIIEIVARYRDLVPSCPHTDQMLYLTVLCAHDHHPLDLEMLLIATDEGLIHDVRGIHEHFDTETGKYRGQFWPRYATQCSGQCTHTGH